MNLVERIADAWQVLLGKPSRGEILASEEIAALKRDAANLTLELQEAKSAVESLRRMLQETNAHQAAASLDPMEEVLAQAAGPLSQLRMQASLMATGKEISGKSVMVLASEVAAVLEAAGLEPIGKVGEETVFDPVSAEPLSSGPTLSPGAPVVIRFIGYGYNGEVLRKALVEALGEKE